MSSFPWAFSSPCDTSSREPRQGAFIKKVDRALLDDEADLAVHCLKDLPGDIPVPDGLAFAGYLTREDIHDAVISHSGAPLAELLECT